MAKSKWFLLLIAEICSALSLVAIIVSYLTDSWVISEIKFEGSAELENSHVSYGLFDGNLNQLIYGQSRLIDLSITCKLNMNKCFYSCQQTSEKRHDEFSRLLNGENLEPCPVSKTKQQQQQQQVKQGINFNEQVKQNVIEEKEEEDAKAMKKINYDVSEMEEAASTYEDEFISAGLWLTTVIFLGLSSIFALISTFFSMINILCNPIRLLSSTYGLYIWNGIAACLSALTMIFWSSAFMIFISKNIAITDTLRVESHYSSNGLAQLGYSFWILFVSIFCHLISIVVVYYRNYLLQNEPAKPIHIDIHKNDSTILVY